MNNRMTELYAKACLDARDIHPTDVPAFIACMAEKFSESIVRECAQVIQAQNDIENYLDSWDHGFVAGLATALDAIEQHFGVES